MKPYSFLLPLLLVVAGSASAAAPVTPGPACSGPLNQQFARLQDDQPQNLCQYAGKVALVVNTASYCGFTSQYQGLEKLYAQFQQRGFVVLGFPSNDFGGQEPGNSKQIGELCFNTYGVKFPMFAKSAVTGSQANPLYAALIKASGQAPQWNFHKYLIDRSGKVVGSYASQTTPDDKALIAAIEKALSAPATK